MVLALYYFILAFAFSLAAQAQAPMAPFLYGEKNFDLYYGPADDPEFSRDPFFGRTRFAPELREKNYVFNFTQLELFELQASLKELEAASVCPDPELAKQYSYIRYLYRLAALSYLDEYLEEANVTAKKMKLNVCQHDLQKLLQECKPQGPDMELFVKSARVLSRNFTPYIPPYDFPFDSHREKWLKDFQSGKALGPVAKRLSQSCDEKKCGKLNQETLSKRLADICAEDAALFIKVCSEKDRLYGLSRSLEAYHAISSSEAMKVIDEEGSGRGCLVRFSRLMSDRESKDSKVAAVVSGTHELLLTRKNSSGGQGRLFPAGSLRRFMQGGLTSIFVEPKPKEVDSVAKTEEAPPPVELAPLAPEPIKEVLQPKPKKVAAQAPKEEPKPEPKMSYFLKTAQARREFGLESVKVDMLQFKYDYIFTSQMISFLDEQMERFASREGLEEMKAFDSLGDKQGPVPLLFVKYLIDKEHHQGLTNLVSVLGEKFYVKNNIDVPELAAPYDYVKLSFEEDSEFVWQLYIEEEP